MRSRNLGKLDSKVAIVTGSGQGIGRGMAIALARAGARVVVCEINSETGKAVAEEINKFGGQAIAAPCDVGVERQVRLMVELTVKTYGPRIDVLINNAQALFIQHDAIEDFPEERWDRTYQSGVKGTWYCCKAVFPYMKEHGGKIINFGSAFGINGREGWSDYAGCKEAIRGFTRSLAKEWAQYNIKANVICPSIVSPSFLQAKAKYPDKIGKLNMGDAERDAGAAAVFLASADESFPVTGHTFHVGAGGITQIHI